MIPDLSHGRRLMMSVGLVHCTDEEIDMSRDPDVAAQAAREAPGEAATSELIDKVMGLLPTPMAVLTVTADTGRPEAHVFLTREELLRHIAECRAIYVAMPEAAKAGDAEWSKYRETVRARGARAEMASTPKRRAKKQPDPWGSSDEPAA
jgi:hypothetical protein